MNRGDLYKSVNITDKEMALVAHARRLDGWKQFHAACAKITVYFDNYVAHRNGMSCRVYTTRPNKRRPETNDLIYLCRGEGHDAVSASIAGLRESGGSSLEAWSAALQMQIEQLAELCDAADRDREPVA